MKKWMDEHPQLMSGLHTIAKTFLAAFIGTILASGVGILEMGAAEWKAAAGAAIAAVLVVAYNWLNPKDDRYGIGAE